LSLETRLDVAEVDKTFIIRKKSAMLMHIIIMILALQITASSTTSSYEQKSSNIVNLPAEFGRIVGGSVVNTPYKYPYMAFFMSNGYKCAGTIINKNHVLSARHCIKGKRPTSRTFVIVGHHKVRNIDAFRSNPEEVFGSNMIRVGKYIVRSDDKDIAILRLVRDIVFSWTSLPACLPDLPAQSYANMEAVATGWGGIVGYNPGHAIRISSELLREVTMDVVEPNTELCTKAVKDQESYLCAYRLGKGACQGDDGGPLIIEQNGKFVVIGVASGGHGCGAQGYADIYTRVSHFREWIEQNAGEVC